MTLYPFCDPYVWENPKVLLNTGFTVKKHKEGACVSEYVNHVVYIYTLACLVGVVTSVFVRASYILSLFVGFATLFCLPTFWLLLVAKDAKEGFADADVDSIEARDPTRKSGSAREVYDVIGKGLGAAPATLTLPSARNPFMNVLIDEIKYNPTRPMAASIMDPSVKVGLDEFFRTEFYSDPTDVFGKTQGQRQFVAMPSTSIPNDVDSYQKWLYRIAGKTCKEGGRESCLPGTDGGALPWLNAA
jgi:hypothetical protein